MSKGLNLRPTILLGLVLFLLQPHSTDARTWYVLPNGSGDAPTIQAAIDSSVARDMVLVAPGTYNETVEIPNGLSHLTLRSESGPEVTTIDGGGASAHVVTIRGDSATVEGFSLVNPGGSVRAGVFTTQVDATILGNWIHDNFRGITASSGGVVTIRANRIWGNVQAIQAITSAAVVAEWNVILHHPGGVGGGVVSIPGPGQVFRNNTVAYNGDNAIAVEFLSGGTPPIVDNNILAHNNRAVRCFSAMPEYFHCNVLWDNTLDFAACDDLIGQDGNQRIDPRFCDSDADDFSLQDGSPCLPENSGCGLIGALPMGCGATSTSARSWGRIKAVYSSE